MVKIKGGQMVHDVRFMEFFRAHTGDGRWGGGKLVIHIATDGLGVTAVTFP